MKSFASVLKPHFRNRVLHLLVKPCQMLVCEELVQVGGDACFKPGLGNSKVLVRFSIIGVQNSKYWELSVCRLIPTVN